MRDLLVFVGIVVLVPVALARPWIGFLGYTLIGFWNPHKFTWYLQDLRIALIVGAATLVGILFTRERRGVPWSREMLLMVLLTIYYTVTSIFSWAPDAAWSQWNQVLRIYFMSFVMGVVIYGEAKIRATLWVFMLGIGFFGIKGGLFSLATGGQDHVLGPETTFLEANTSLGLAFNMTIPLLVFAAQEQTIRWRRWAIYSAALLTIIATIFTYSRGAWVGLAATVPFLLLRIKRGILIALLLMPVALVAMTLVPEKVYTRVETIDSYEEDKSAMTRIQAWSVAWNVAVESPLLGGGFDYENHPDRSRWLAHADRKYDSIDQTPRAAHSIYFQVLGQHGFVALGLFLGLLVSTLLSFSGIARAVRDTPEIAWIAGYAKAMQVGMIGYVVSGAFLNLAYFDLVYLYVAFVPILRREIRDHRVAREIGRAAFPDTSNVVLVASRVEASRAPK